MGGQVQKKDYYVPISKELPAVIVASSQEGPTKKHQNYVPALPQLSGATVDHRT
jgi:hypothetical protein